jgi:hypothetical protein
MNRVPTSQVRGHALGRDVAVPRFPFELPSLLRASLGGVASASNANASSGVVNREKPQSKQTKIFGNTKTLGLSRFLRPEKWIFISAANSSSLADVHS